MWKSLVLAWVLMFSATGASEKVELFDTDKEKVVHTYENLQEFQKEGRTILQSANRRVVDAKPSLKQALIVKIPLQPPQKVIVKDTDLKADIIRMFVIIPKNTARDPWLILHTQEGETLVLDFTEKIDRLMKMIAPHKTTD